MPFSDSTLSFWKPGQNTGYVSRYHKRRIIIRHHMYRDTRPDVISTADNVENRCKRPVACTTFNNTNLFQTIMYNVFIELNNNNVAATGQSYIHIVYNREIQSWLTGSFCDFHQVSRYVSYRDSSIAIRIVSWGYRIVTPLCKIPLLFILRWERNFFFCYIVVAGT